MKILIILFFVINLFASEKYTYDVKFGFLQTGTVLSNFKDARKSLSKWLNDIAEEENARVQVFYYKDSKTMYKDFKAKKISMIVLDMDYFFKKKNEISRIGGNFWTLSNKDNIYTQFYLIANKSINSKGFKDIKNRTLTIKENDLAAISWLNKRSLQSNKRSYEKVLKKFKTVNKDSTSLLNVFFKKTDYAIVTKKTWNTMVELNPAIKKKVMIVSKSKEIHLPFIGLFANDADKKAMKSFFNLSKDMKSLTGGTNIINLLKFDFLLKIDEISLYALEHYYNEYFTLQKKYK